MRKNNVIALLEHAANDLSGSNLENIEQQYKQSLDDKTIPTSLQIDVKNFMENLRSAMDYMANDIYENVIMPARTKAGEKEIKDIYFPYGKTENDFKSGLGSNLPKIQSLSPAIYTAIESIQPHKCGDDWLYQFCRILNEKKHDTLTPQKREEKRSLKLDFPGGAGISIPPGGSISGGGMIQSGTGKVILNNDSISGDSPARNTSGGVAQTVIRWVSFKFADTDVEVLPLLKKALKNIEQLSKSIYSELE
jgi:hypothetical protein